MSTMTKKIECPNCGSKKAFEDTNTGTIESQINCPRCGYARSVSYKRDEDGKPILKDKNGEDNIDNYIPEVKELADPYGAFMIKYIDGMVQMGCLEDEDDMEEFEKWVKKLKKNNNVELIKVSRVVDEEKKEKILYKREEQGV